MKIRLTPKERARAVTDLGEPTFTVAVRPWHDPRGYQVSLVRLDNEAVLEVYGVPMTEWVETKAHVGVAVKGMLRHLDKLGMSSKTTKRSRHGHHKNPRNFDYPQPLEGRMAKSYLWSIERDARELREKLEDDDDLPGWVIGKLATAEDRVQTVARYLGHKIARHKSR
jgi:hypothetical protein